LTTIDVPLPTEVPPQEPVYQSTVSPEFTVADRVDGSPGATDDGDAVTLVGVLGRALTVTVTLAQALLTQPVVVLRARA